MSSRGFGKKRTVAAPKNRVPKETSVDCACGSGMPYERCCMPFHQGVKSAATPLELLRSRYSAYAFRLPLYLMRTTHSSHEDYRSDTNVEGQTKWCKTLLKFCDSNKLFTLVPHETLYEEGDPDIAYITFDVTMQTLGRKILFNERSKFVRENDAWLYFSGDPKYTPEASHEKASSPRQAAA